MLGPKKKIPSLVGATLALTGCGGGDDGPTTLTGKAFNAFCMKVAECYPDDPYAEECFGYVASYDLAGKYFSNECDVFFASYLNCFSDLTCEEFMGDEYYACGDDVDQEMLQACLEELPEP